MHELYAMCMADVVFDENRESLLAEKNKVEVEGIGQRLWAAGGLGLMLCVYYGLQKRLDAHGKDYDDCRMLEMAWNGIGTWCS